MAQTALGCALIGAPVVALSTWSRRVELEYALDHSQAVALVTLDRFLGTEYQAMLDEIIPEATRRPPGRIGAAPLPALRELIVLGQPALAAARPFDAVLARGRRQDPAGVRAASAAVRPTDLLYVLYTSGSTARPKGVTLAHAACLENGFHIGERQHLFRGCHDHPRAGTESPRRAGHHRPLTPPQRAVAADAGAAAHPHPAGDDRGRGPRDHARP